METRSILVLGLALLVGACDRPKARAPVEALPPTPFLSPTAPSKPATAELAGEDECGALEVTRASVDSPFENVLVVVGGGSPIALDQGFVTGPASDEHSSAIVYETPDREYARLAAGTELEFLTATADSLFLISGNERGGCVYKLDRSSLRVRWSRTIREPVFTSAWPRAEVKDGVIHYVIGETDGTFDLETGARLVRPPLPIPVIRPDPTTGLIVSYDTRSVTAVPTGSGAGWQRNFVASGQAERVLRVSIGRDYAAVLLGRSPKGSETCRSTDHTDDPWWCELRMATLRLRDGSVAFLGPWSHSAGAYDVLVAGKNDDVYWSVPARASGVSGRAVELRSMANGALRWRTPAVPCADSGMMEGTLPTTYVSVDDRFAYACGCDGIVRRYERLTGKEAGSFGVGICRQAPAVSNGVVILPFVQRDSPGKPTTWGTYPAYCSDDCIASMLVIRPEAFSAPETKQLVHGNAAVEFPCDLIEPAFSVRPPHRVRIGDQFASTDRAGGFSATVHGRGFLSADIVVPERWTEQCGLFNEEPVTFKLTKKPHEVLSFSLQQNHHYVLGDGP